MSILKVAGSSPDGSQQAEPKQALTPRPEPLREPARRSAGPAQPEHPDRPDRRTNPSRQEAKPRRGPAPQVRPPKVSLGRLQQLPEDIKGRTGVWCPVTANKPCRVEVAFHIHPEGAETFKRRAVLAFEDAGTQRCQARFFAYGPFQVQATWRLLPVRTTTTSAGR
jgi:hypothetical protein